MLYEVQLGPYESLEDAERAAATVAESFGLAPTVTVEREGP